MLKKAIVVRLKLYAFDDWGFSLRQSKLLKKKDFALKQL